VYLTGKSPSTSTSACPFDSGAPYFSEDNGKAQLVATDVDGPTCPHSGEEITARIDVVVPWINAQIHPSAR